MSLSFSEIRKSLCDAFTAAFPNSGGDIVDIYQDRCIIRDNTGALYEVPYTINEDGRVVTGDLTRVRRQIEYVMVQANALNLNDVEAGTAPAEIQVIPHGRHDTPKGVFVCDEESATLVLNAFNASSNDMVIDYEHQTLASPPIPAPAAGWIKALVNRGTEGIWAAVEWTNKAKQMIANKEYRYVSPVFAKRTADDKVFWLINVALTNQPNIDGMVPLINTAKPTKEEPMWKKLLQRLGLAETATEDDAIAAINKMTPPAVVANKAVLDVLGLKETATEAEVTGTIMAMKQGSTQVAELAAQVKDLTDKLAGMETEDLVTVALNDGKITPAQKDWAEEYAKRDPDGFKVFISKAPQVVVKGKIVTGDKPGEGGIDDTQAMINKMCGVDDETYKKYGPKEG